LALIIDTGPLYALLDRSDRSHQQSRRLLEAFPERLIVPSPVLVEVDLLVSSRMRRPAFEALLEDILGGRFRVEDLTLEDYSRARDLCAQYADSDIGFVDAAVLAIVERLGEPKLATLDHRHFGMMRPRHVDALILLPE